MTAKDAIKIIKRMLEYIEEEQGENPDFYDFGNNYKKIKTDFFRWVANINSR